MKINYAKIKEDAEKLEKFPGYLPGIIQMEINVTNYFDFLKKEGLWDDLEKELYRSRRFSFQEHLDDFKKWVNNHPEYENYIIED